MEIVSHAREMGSRSVGVDVGIEMTTGSKVGGRWCVLFHDLWLSSKGEETGKSEACHSSRDGLQRGRHPGSGVHSRRYED
jgi:hypothetical protein